MLPQVYQNQQVTNQQQLQRQKIPQSQSFYNKSDQQNMQNSFISFYDIQQQNRKILSIKRPDLFSKKQSNYKYSDNYNNYNQSFGQNQQCLNDQNSQTGLVDLKQQDKKIKSRSLQMNKVKMVIEATKYNKYQESIIKQITKQNMMCTFYQLEKDVYDYKSIIKKQPAQKVCAEQQKINNSSNRETKSLDQKVINKRRKGIRQSNIELNEYQIRQLKNDRLIQKKKQTQRTELVLFANVDDQLNWKPQVREQGQFLTNEQKTKGYLIFGLGTELIQDICEFDVYSSSWRKVSQQESKSGRCGHSCVFFNKNIYVFGGEKMFNPIIKQRECLSDLKQLILMNKQNPESFWKNIKTTGEIMEARRNHGSCLLLKYMVVYGGVNNRNQYLNDLWFLDLVNSIWMKMKVNSSASCSNQNMAFHQILPIFHESRTKIVPGKQLQALEEGCKKYIKKEGIFMFGGKNENGLVANGLQLMQFDNQMVSIKAIETVGNQPCPRYGHQMKHDTTNNCLIIHGGINDSGVADQLLYLNDLHILDLFSLNWLQVQLHGDSLVQRAFFQMEFISMVIMIIVQIIS